MPTMRAIKARLTRERCDGDRWAKAIAHLFDDVGVNLDTDAPTYWHAAYDRALSKD
ncbi:hypothetical protein [Thiolapillus sp.]|uniref:hypothetical protein n=1 Tax=Thiolapillus sp. TaxID=2017437 RepID=UPI003AF88196